MVRVSFENCINKINASHQEKLIIEKSRLSKPSSNDSFVIKQLPLLLKRLDSSIINEKMSEAEDIIQQLQVGNSARSYCLETSNYC